MLNKFLDASKAFGQTISLSKTEVLYQPALNTTPVEPNISIDDTPLANVHSFNYLAWTASSYLIYLLNVSFSMSLFPNSAGIAVWFNICSFLKRLSSSLFSEVFLPFSNSTILSGRTGRYEEVDDRLSFSLVSLEASMVCSLAWILYEGGIFFSEYLCD